MAVQLESAERLAALRDKADAVTGESSATLAGAVDALIAGFGAGGGGTGENWLDYVSGMQSMFNGAALPEIVDITVGSKLPSFTGGAASAFSSTTGVKQLKWDIGCNTTGFSMDSCFRTCSAEILELPFLETTPITTFNRCFQNMPNLREIRTPINASGKPSFNNCFNVYGGAPNIELIMFVPGTIMASISFGYCEKLNDTSIQSIVDGLADLTGGTAQTLTLHATTGAKLTDAQKTAISAKNWTVTY
jgi:hypothetical protein